ncbi:acyl-CoA dehydrogenase family protein, partial [Lichenihabitans sp. Uapishka_5]|uniref:acyl-CoA dehydrogenase family protein n=1 Tax=Lichenihabitans sp. Uapishka_5 TaxID=3037302 RepID=UPI0029E81D37
MTLNHDAWGAGPTDRYHSLMEPFRPVLTRIRDGAAARERNRLLPHAELGWLKQAGLTAVRLPAEQGGAGASLPEFFALLIELSAADSNLAQALRSHFGFVEEILQSSDAAHRATWIPRIARGDTVGSARSEGGAATQAHFDTVATRDRDGWRIDGAKFYTTGSLYADWLHVAATRAEDGVSVTGLVSRQAPGLVIEDDWDGFGQRLTASGTARFTQVPVRDADMVEDSSIFPYTLPFYQLVHLATLAGIGRAAARELAEAVAGRRRSYTHGAA